MSNKVEPVSDYEEDMGSVPNHSPKTNQQIENEIKKENIKNVFGSGVGRISLITVVLVFLILICISVYGLFKKRTQTQDDVTTAAGAVIGAPTQGDSMVTSEQERALRIASSNHQAEDAARKGESYMAPPVLKVEDPNAISASGSASTIAGPAANAQANNPAQTEQNRINAQLQSQQQKPVQAQNLAEAQAAANAAELKTNWPQTRKTEIEPQMLVALGRSEQSQNSKGFHESIYALPDRSEKTNSTVAAAAGLRNEPSSMPSKTGVPFIQAGDAYYCETMTKINTDDSRNDVVVNCESGKIAGSRLIGKWDMSKESAVEGSITISLTAISLKGRPLIPIQAIAIDDENDEIGMADEVDDHTFRKYSGIAISSFVMGLGKAASIVTGTTNVFSTGGTTQTQIVTDPITPARQAKIALGETGVAVGGALQKQSDKITRTIKLNKKKGVRILFLSDVFTEKK